MKLWYSRQSKHKDNVYLDGCGGGPFYAEHGSRWELDINQSCWGCLTDEYSCMTCICTVMQMNAWEDGWISEWMDNGSQKWKQGIRTKWNTGFSFNFSKISRRILSSQLVCCFMSKDIYTHMCLYLQASPFLFVFSHVLFHYGANAKS